MPKFALAPACAAALLLAACESNPPPAPDAINVPASFAPVTVPLIVEGDQIFVEMDAKRPDGAARPIIANINMGHANPGVQKHVVGELGLAKDRPFAFTLAGLPVVVADEAVWKLDDFAAPDRQLGPFFSPDLNLEGWLQAAVLQKFEIVLDYSAKTLTLAPPGSLSAQGVPVPIRWNEQTGLVTADLIVDGRPYPIVIDCGSPYTWIRPSVAKTWLAGHPERYRTHGAVGVANYNMLDYAFEKEGTVVRLPDAKLGALEIHNLGVLATGPLLGWPLDTWMREFVFDEWQEGAPEPVIGWLGANMLKHYRVTIDYRNRISYWLKLSDIDPHELDQVGVTLVYRHGEYRIGGIVEKNGKPTVEGVEIGDRILAIDDAPIEHWSRDQIFTALGGRVGNQHRLAVERNGKQVLVKVPVTEF